MELKAVGDRIIAAVKSHVSQALKDLTAKVAALEAREPVPGPKGDKGDTGECGQAGPVGPQGAAGERGEVGPGVRPEDVQAVVEAVFARSWLELERRATDQHQRFLERLPAPKDGKDAFELEDLAVEHDGDGNVTLRFVRGELAREFRIRLPRFKDRGVYRDGETYAEGDGVSYAGSFWLAQQDSPPLRPDAPESGWRLAVKRGRDGKNGTPAAAAPEVVKYR